MIVPGFAIRGAYSSIVLVDKGSRFGRRNPGWRDAFFRSIERARTCGPFNPADLSHEC
jgi:hypothetical protein